MQVVMSTADALLLGQESGYEGKQATSLEVELIFTKDPCTCVEAPAMPLVGVELKHGAQGCGYLGGFAAVEDKASRGFLGVGTRNVRYTADQWGDPGQAARHGFEHRHALGLVIGAQQKRVAFRV